MPPMANHSPRGRGGGGFRSRFKLNPAFAQAHGMTIDEPAIKEDDAKRNQNKPEKKKSTTELPISPSPVQHSPQNNNNNNNNPTTKTDKVNRAIAKARANGKLQVADSGLETPLPKMLFEFPGLEADMSLDTNPDQLKPWESHVAETLGLVDFSDNEGITEFPSFPPHPDSQHTSNHSVERYRSVHIFRARRCNLQKFAITPSLPESWSQLSTLDLSGNKLTGEFALLYLPKTIRELDLSGNQLSSLKSARYPSTSVDLPHLVSLDISNNEIASTGISPVLHLPALQRINVGHNKIFNLNFILKAIGASEKSLTTLNAPKSLLSDLDGRQPIDLTNFLALLSVDLSENSLCRPPKIPVGLQRLNVNMNEIMTTKGLIPDDASASSLVVLQMQRNKLKSLDPQMLLKLTQLNRLDLQFNALSNLPLELGDLTNLQQMFLEGNNLNALRSAGVRGDLNDTKAILMRLRAKKPELDAETIPSQASSGLGKPKTPTKSQTINVEMGGLLSSLLVGTKTLKYEGKHAHMLPFQLLEELKTGSKDIVENIECFIVSKNQLQTIESNWFNLLPQMTVLEAQDNRLNSIPANIRETGLTQILMSRNSLTSHAVQFSILLTSSKSNSLTDTLQTLDLSTNQLDVFSPLWLRHFKSLRTLNLSRNKITSLKNIVDAPLPPACPALEHLDLSENQIEDMGGDDFPLLLKLGCPKLQSLRLDNNEAAMIPMSFGLLDELENFKTLDIRGNPQRMIRYDILDKNTSDVLQYMRSRMTAKTKENIRLKTKELLDASEENVEPPLAVPTPAPAPAPAPKSKLPPPMTKSLVSSPPASPTKTSPNYASPQKREIKEPKSGTPTPKRPSVRQTATSAARVAASHNKEVQTPKKQVPTPIKPTSPPGGSPWARAGSIPTPRTRQGLAPVALSSNSPRRPSATKPKTNASSKDAASGDKHTKSSLLQELEKSIEALAAEYERPGLSEPKRYAIKKKLAMERSKRLREERRLKQERAHSGIY